MPILELDSEAAQLRQVARSFAEGDLEFEDYRQIRTAVIDGFAERFGAGLSEGPIAGAVPAGAGVEANAEPSDESWAMMATLGAAAMLLFVVAASFLLG